MAKVHDYGAFVRIPDSRQQGLVHRSQVSSTRVDDVTEVLQRGERIWCKVISINVRKLKTIGSYFLRWMPAIHHNFTFSFC